MPRQSYVLWQLIDSALPTGALAHSGGLEAYAQAQVVDNLRQTLSDLLAQLVAGQVPLMRQVLADPQQLQLIDERCEALLSNHVAKRASLAQGRALLSVAEKMFPDQAFTQWRQAIRYKTFHAHLSPVYAFVLHCIGISDDEIIQSFLYVSLRDMVSAAIRLGLCGPIEAQRIQLDFAERLDGICAAFAQDEPEQIHPILEVVHAMHDRLYSRLFSS